MGSAHLRTAGAIGALATCAALAGCVASRADGGPSGALFKAQVGDISGGIAPGPHSVWYVQKQPAAYVKMGFATWQPEPRHGLRAWFARHFGHRPAANLNGELSGVAAANISLPVPSRVQVTNVATGQVITVRVDDKAPMADGILRLTPAAAKSLGADLAKPLLIRMRYLSPVVAYNERPTLRYAFRGAPRRADDAPQPAAPTVLAAQVRSAPAVAAAAAAPPLPPLTPLPLPRPPAEMIRVATSAPAPPAMPVLRSMQPVPVPRVGSRAQPPVNSFRVQAGAFASLANAHHAVQMLEPAGRAIIEPTQRGAMTLYRVIVPGPRDAAAAERLRTRVAQVGFADARLLRPL